jgi:hypothetical protein
MPSLPAHEKDTRPFWHMLPSCQPSSASGSCARGASWGSGTPGWGAPALRGTQQEQGTTAQAEADPLELDTAGCLVDTGAS